MRDVETSCVREIWRRPWAQTPITDRTGKIRYVLMIIKHVTHCRLHRKFVCFLVYLKKEILTAHFHLTVIEID